MEKDNDNEDLLTEGLEAFELCSVTEGHNRNEALDDLRFAKLGEQWPADIKADRESEGRPCLTINKMPTFIRQVVNDARQNKPSIKIRPVDSNADPETAEVISGLIRNIEYTSNADVAYDTAIDSAVSGGVGYVRIGLDYAFDDSFDMDITIERIINPFAVYGDPHSTAADGSDWNVAFVVDRLSKAAFKRKYKGKADVDFDGDAWGNADSTWLNDDGVMIAEWWQREEIERKIAILNDGRVFEVEELQSDPDLSIALETGILTIEKTRTAKSYKVTQTIMSGVDILEQNEWAGKFIPIIPVYGDEFAVEGKRYFRSLINPAKDAQRMFNYWRTTSTELVALAPRVPFIGKKGAFDSDINNWNTANTVSHSFLEYDGDIAPQRQPLDMGVAAGALQEALNASDDMKAIVGLYDASLGARSNETSGKAIMARQREGDVSTFHFIDNLSRAIRQIGRIIIDLIPSVYDSERIIRVIGEDAKEKSVQINAPFQKQDENGDPVTQPGQDEEGNEIEQAVLAIHDLTVGKYDLTVTAGPSFTTRREEAAAQMTELVRAFPQAAPFIADIMAKNFDWPGADEIAKRFEQMNPANQKKGLPPQIQQMIEQGKAKIAELEQENRALKADKSIDMAKVKVDAFEAQTNRIEAVGPVNYGP